MQVILEIGGFQKIISISKPTPYIKWKVPKPLNAAALSTVGAETIDEDIITFTYKEKIGNFFIYSA